MPSCSDIEPSLAAYVDGACDPGERGSIEAHLGACPQCRVRVSKEHTAHALLRTRCRDLRGCAPEALRARCAAQRAAAPAEAAGRQARGGFARRETIVRLSLAAGVILAAGIVLIFGLGNSVERYGAQLAADHLKCFQYPPDAAQVDAASIGRVWQAAYGWPLRVASSSASEELELLGTRRCASTSGSLAHVLYRWRGRPLSLYVLNGRIPGVADASDAADSHHAIRRLGEQEVIWAERGRTYALVAQASAADLQQMARYVRRLVE